MKFYVPKRWILVFFLHTAILLEYTLRVNLSVASIPMKEKYNWNEHEKGLMLSAFYWGYTFGQIPVNILVYHFKAKYILAVSLFLSSLFTLLSPSACDESFSSGLWNRGLVGLFASATYPACFHYFAPWIPLSEKTLLINIILTGAYMVILVYSHVIFILVCRGKLCVLRFQDFFSLTMLLGHFSTLFSDGWALFGFLFGSSLHMKPPRSTQRYPLMN